MHTNTNTLNDPYGAPDPPPDPCPCAKDFEKERARLDFQMKRILKDKSIVINLLNKTIEEQKEQKEIIEKANQALSRQKAEIEAKNTELQQQKRLLEEQSTQMAEHLHELEMSYSELEQFSYIASHDLKSPLRSIASYAGLLKRRYGGQLDADADQFIDFIVKGASHMNEIISDLLEYSSSGKERQLAKTDLNQVLEMVMFNLKEEIAESKAQIEYSNLPELTVHSSGMVQLFQNLLGNAIKFKSDAAPLLKITCEKQNGTWYFAVADNGLGMEEEYQEKAFKPFQRVNHLDRPGTGMGLAICKKIVKMHKGEIWYKSQLGAGSTFHFTIPQNIF
jgi:light-regulated signal transduction histidine kinase (bacteriophytochrome)